MGMQIIVGNVGIPVDVDMGFLNDADHSNSSCAGALLHIDQMNLH